MNVFVYHAEDREGCLLAEVLRRLASGTYLLPSGGQWTPPNPAHPVDGPTSRERMSRFLSRLGAGQTRLPFIVVMHVLGGICRRPRCGSTSPDRPHTPTA